MGEFIFLWGYILVQIDYSPHTRSGGGRVAATNMT